MFDDFVQASSWAGSEGLLLFCIVSALVMEFAAGIVGGLVYYQRTFGFGWSIREAKTERLIAETETEHTVRLLEEDESRALELERRKAA